MRLLRYAGRRLLYVVPQLVGITFLTFLLIRLIPGDPAFKIAGVAASPQTIAEIHRRLGLDKPLLEQYWLYFRRVAEGNLGFSWYTSNPVAVDLLHRLPATLELVTLGLLISLIVMVPLGVITALRPQGRASKGAFFYGMMAGALPDFWLGLILVFIFYVQLGWAPAPMGRIGLIVTPPEFITGMYLVDSLLTFNWAALKSTLAHLVLPLITLVFVYGGLILKMTQRTMVQVLDSNFIHHARASGLKPRRVVLYAFKNALPPVITITGVEYVYLLGGAVLVETVFGWGGAGQYAVQSIINSDFEALQGFVLVSAVFSMGIYLIVDILYFAVDPRIRL